MDHPEIPLYAAGRAERLKHKKYQGVAEQRELTFYAFAVEVSGALGMEAQKCLAEILHYMADSCGSSVLKALR